ncbi:hypothetical protein B0H13DRAFT_2516718 [Mycena leptocephala]|nr:hypothetical protein B0H13DRAFT_2516718 [Mycena leptocephala]
MLRRTIQGLARRDPPALASSTPAVPVETQEHPPPSPPPSKPPTPRLHGQQTSCPAPGPPAAPALSRPPWSSTNPLSAMALVNDVPPTMVDGRRAVCDGGGGPLGHPKIYINLVWPLNPSLATQTLILRFRICQVLVHAVTGAMKRLSPSTTTN